MLIFHYFPLNVNCIFHKSPIYGKLLLSFHSRGPELGGAQGPVRRSEPEPAAEDLCGLVVGKVVPNMVILGFLYVFSYGNSWWCMEKTMEEQLWSGISGFVGGDGNVAAGDLAETKLENLMKLPQAHGISWVYSMAIFWHIIVKDKVG